MALFFALFFLLPIQNASAAAVDFHWPGLLSYAFQGRTFSFGNAGYIKSNLASARELTVNLRLTKLRFTSDCAQTIYSTQDSVIIHSTIFPNVLPGQTIEIPPYEVDLDLIGISSGAYCHWIEIPEVNEFFAPMDIWLTPQSRNGGLVNYHSTSDYLTGESAVFFSAGPSTFTQSLANNILSATAIVQNFSVSYSLMLDVEPISSYPAVNVEWYLSPNLENDCRKLVITPTLHQEANTRLVGQDTLSGIDALNWDLVAFQTTITASDNGGTYVPYGNYCLWANLKSAPLNASLVPRNDFSNTVIYVQPILFEEPTAILNTSVEQIAHIFPNPAKNQVTLKLSRPSNDLTMVQILDIHGRIVIPNLNPMEINQMELKIDVSTLPAGNYWVNIQSGNQSKQSLRLVKVN